MLLVGLGLIACVALATAVVLATQTGLVRGAQTRQQQRLRQRLAESVVGQEQAAMGLLPRLVAQVRRRLVASILYRRWVAPLLERRRREQLRECCLNDLPEMIDILSLALGAGLSFDQAFERYLESFDTPLAQEFARALQAYQVGMCSRTRACEEVAARREEESVLRFVAAIRQAFTLGSALAPTFDMLAFETRRYRKARLEERIAKTPVKLLLPLGTCILPAVLIVLMGPVMTQVINGLNF
jgi:tight adherence protein C